MGTILLAYLLLLVGSRKEDNMRCSGCGEDFGEDELKKGLCADCQYVIKRLHAMRHVPPIRKLAELKRKLMTKLVYNRQ